MGKLNDIRQKLSAGSTTKELIDQGYAKSSVFNVTNKLKGSHPNITGTPVSDALQELINQRESKKVQNEIADLYAAGDKLPDRMAALEQTVLKLRSLLCNAVDTALFICLREAERNYEEADQYANGCVEKNIKGQ